MTRPEIRRRTGRALLLALALGIWTVGPVSATTGHRQQPDPPRVILVIADGAGISHWTVGLVASDSTALWRFPVVGLVDSRNVEGRITDSAASATAYATGSLSHNGFVGVGPDSASLETVMERAAARGMATGLIATSSIVHATPASFIAHVPDRNDYEEIAAQMAVSSVDVLLGGGRRFFDPARRRDGRDFLTLLGRNRDWAMSPGDLDTIPAPGTPGLVGLFAENAMPTAYGGRSPTLAQMTAAAIAVLDQDPDGFLLMVESSQIDWLAHDNDPFEPVAAEMLDCDEVLHLVLDYAEGRSDVLVVVVADHETGGLALLEDAGEWKLAYSSGGHTAELTPLFASGVGAEKFGGVHRVDEIGRVLAEVVLGAERAD